MHHAFLRDSDVLPVLKAFAAAGFVLGWLPLGPIVEDAHKSVALSETKGEGKPSALLA